MPRIQCSKCPWKVYVNPHDIPDGYSEEKHKALKCTISDEDLIRRDFRVMACHESFVGEELPCVGWIVNQLGTGNNLNLRLAVIRGEIDTDIELDGEQHLTFEATYA